jgi:hypothetical protein
MRSLLLAVSTLALTSCVVVSAPQSSNGGPPPPAAPQVRGAASGVAQKFNAYYAVTPECTSAGPMTVKVVKAPEHGSLKIEDGEGYPNYDKDNVRFACNKVKVPVTQLVYTSNPNYVGQDTITLDAWGPGGRFFHQDFVINVR